MVFLSTGQTGHRSTVTWNWPCSWLTPMNSTLPTHDLFLPVRRSRLVNCTLLPIKCLHFGSLSLNSCSFMVCFSYSVNITNPNENWNYFRIFFSLSRRSLCISRLMRARDSATFSGGMISYRSPFTVSKFILTLLLMDHTKDICKCVVLMWL